MLPLLLLIVIFTKIGHTQSVLTVSYQQSPIVPQGNFNVGARLPGTESLFTFTLHNSGETPLLFLEENQDDLNKAITCSIVGRDAAVFQWVALPSELPPGSKGEITLQYTPNSPGPHRAQLEFRDIRTQALIHMFHLHSKNHHPTLNPIPDLSTEEDIPIKKISLRANDIENGKNLTILAKSDNPSLIPNTGIIHQKDGDDFFLSIVPAPHQYGKATITVSVHDGFDRTSRDFEVTVSPVNDAPAITFIKNQANESRQNEPLVQFRVLDIDHPLDQLTIQAESRNPARPTEEMISLSRVAQSAYKKNYGPASMDFILAFNEIPKLQENLNITIIASDGLDTTEKEISLLLSNETTGQFMTAIPTEYMLEPVFPNPFNPETTIRFSLPERTPIQLDVRNIRGQWIQSLLAKDMDAGFHTINWNAHHLESGLYIISLQTPKYVHTQKCMLLK